MTSSLDMIRGRSNIVTLTNKSGGALVAGDVCVIDTSNDESATTTTSAASALKVYIAAESIADNATGKFYSSGFCPLVTPSASTTRGRYLFTHTVAKQAAESATYGIGAFGIILKSGTTPSVWLFGSTAQTGGGGVSRSGSTANGNLAVWNGADADSIKDGGAVPTPGRVLISEQTPTNTTATFSTIPGTYKTLVIDWIARTDKASVATETGIMWLNGDTTATNYRELSLNANGSTVATSGADDAIVFLFPAATATAGLAAYGTVLIPYYALTTFQKAAKIESYERDGATSQNFRIKQLFWENTVAITQIDIVTQSSGNFVSGSTFRLYGVI